MLGPGVLTVDFTNCDTMPIKPLLHQGTVANISVRSLSGSMPDNVSMVSCTKTVHVASGVQAGRGVGILVLLLVAVCDPW